MTVERPVPVGEKWVYEHNGFWLADYGPNRVYSNMLWTRADAEAFEEPEDWEDTPLMGTSSDAGSGS